MAKKNLSPVTSSEKCFKSLVMHYIRVKFFFLHNKDLLGIKRRRILRRIKKCKLTSVQNCTKKKLWAKKDLKKKYLNLFDSNDLFCAAKLIFSVRLPKIHFWATTFFYFFQKPSGPSINVHL